MLTVKCQFVQICLQISTEFSIANSTNTNDLRRCTVDDDVYTEMSQRAVLTTDDLGLTKCDSREVKRTHLTTTT